MRASCAFACSYWTFSSTVADEIALMNDLFVEESHRGRGVGRALIEATVEAARERDLHHVEWFTAPDNEVAQRLYGRMGAVRSEWVAYEIDTRDEPPSSVGATGGTEGRG